MKEGITFKEGSYGKRAVLQTSWSNSVERFLLEHNIAELELNAGNGWRGIDLSFLAAFPEIKAFVIIDHKITSVAPVHVLRKLMSLDINTYCKTELKMDCFPLLEECILEWRPKIRSLFDCQTLRRLFINRYDGKDVEPFSRLVNLESLGLLGAPIKNLFGLSKLKKMRSLRLGNIRTLTSLEGVNGLENLEHLNINTCRNIGSLKPIEFLSKLRTLDINNCGEIASLDPLRGLPLLERVTFYESTNILDGDMSPLKQLKNLSSVAFQNRRHYSLKREEFPEYSNKANNQL